MEEFILQTILLQKEKLDNCLNKLKIPNSAKIQIAKANLISKIRSSIARNQENSFVKIVRLHHGCMRNGIAQTWKDRYADLILLLIK